MLTNPLRFSVDVHHPIMSPNRSDTLSFPAVLDVIRDRTHRWLLFTGRRQVSRLRMQHTPWWCTEYRIQTILILKLVKLSNTSTALSGLFEHPNRFFLYNSKDKDWGNAYWHEWSVIFRFSFMRSNPIRHCEIPIVFHRNALRIMAIKTGFLKEVFLSFSFKKNFFQVLSFLSF